MPMVINGGAADNGSAVNNGRVVVSGAAYQHGKAARVDPSRPELAMRRNGTPWRFVLVVEPAPDSLPRGRATIDLAPTTARKLGPGATLLEEPFDPVVRIRFDWPASARAEAIVAAIRSVEANGLRVLRVDNDDPVTVADVALRIGKSRETVRLWAAGRTGPGGFPPPVNPRRDTTFYAWSEVLPWLRERKGLDLPEEEPALVAASLAIRLRALLPRVDRPGPILDLLGIVPQHRVGGVQPEPVRAGAGDGKT